MPTFHRKGRIPPGTPKPAPTPPPAPPRLPKEYRLRIYCTTCMNEPGNGACATAKRLTNSLPTRMAYHDPNYTGTFVCEWELGIDFCSAKAKAAPTTTATVTQALTRACGTLTTPAATAAAAANTTTASLKRVEPFKVDDLLNGLKTKGVAYKTTPSAFN